jgi:peptidoglycan-N-acetylglucosamine deacetylase
LSGSIGKGAGDVIRYAWGIAIAAVVLCGAEASAMPCGRPGALGVSRVISVDARTLPVVGVQDYGVRLPLAPGEVVLTFDDGPNPASTPSILKTLADECLRATFFMVGRQARAHPETARQVRAAGHTVGTHTQNHPLRRLPRDREIAEIETGIASVTAALGAHPAPFFRFPGLYRTREAEQYLHERGIVVWSDDVDSYDWKHNDTTAMLNSTVARLEARHGGILLMHDIKPRTARVLPRLIAMLKARGFRIVHVVPRGAYPAGLIAMSQRPHSPNVDIAGAPTMMPVRAGSRRFAEKSSFDSIFSPRASR